jgi:hypothetical protein
MLDGDYFISTHSHDGFKGPLDQAREVNLKRDGDHIEMQVDKLGLG